MYDNYREFKSLDDARNFGIKYYGDWLKEFQIGGKYRNIYELSDYDYLNLKNKKGKPKLLREKLSLITDLWELA